MAIPTVSAGIANKALFFYTTLTIFLSTVGFWFFQSSDPCRCKTLLEQGFWLNAAEYKNWQPAGCMLHTYRPAEAQSCLAEKRVVFVGGETTRSVFDAVALKVDPSFDSGRAEKTNQIVNLENVKFEFIWDPTFQSSEIKEVAYGYEFPVDTPALTVLGIEREYIEMEREDALWAAKMGALLHQFGSDVPRKSRQSDALVMLPVLTTANSTTPQLTAANDVLLELAKRYNVDVANAIHDIVGLPDGMATSDIPSKRVSPVIADVLLNRRCNIQLPKHYPYASTCCNNYPAPSWVQIVGILFVFIAVPVAAYLYHSGYTADSSTLLRFLPESRFHWPIFVMGATVALCYYCDRTNVFGKEQKQTSPSQFFILMGLIIAGSLFTMKTETKDQAFLNRDQTDEWKGWMQVAILVYHYVGVSKTAYIYNYMRVMPTSYLFMTGFGHTVYFLKKDDFSFKRYAATMLRLNLLNVILAYMMGNDWLLYYFAPLVTWNFHVAFFLLWAGHKHNKNKLFLFGKMAIAAGLNTAFYRTPGVLEFFWSLLQTVFRMQGDLREWRFRITLDQYSMFPGMIAAVLFLNWGSFELPKSAKWNITVKAVSGVSAAIMIWYAFFESSQPSKQIYNSKHTYVSWLPCCAFVILRNATPWLRKTHNGFFAWVGRGSLETFLLQFHIWLAADTAGLLMFGPPQYRFLNAIIATPIFFWVANLTTQATGGVIEWIMAAEPKRSLPVVKPQPSPESEKLTAISEVKPVDVEKTASVEEVEVPSTWQRMAKAGHKDLRVRMGVILLFMAVANWTY